MYECSICNQHARTDLVGLLRHIREVHPHFATRVTCGLNSCPATPSSFEALRRHVYRYHYNLLNISTQESNAIPEGGNINGEEEQSFLFETHTNEQSLSPTQGILGAQFILKTRDGKQLTQVTTDGIIQDTKLILQSTVENLERKVMEKIANLGIAVTTDQLTEIKAVFSDDSLLDPFKGLETEYKQEKFIQENFNYVVSTNSCT